MRTYFSAALLLGFAGILSAQNASAPAPIPVPVEQEPLHHVVLRNDSIIVMHVVIPPGDRSLFHIHSHDRVAIELTTSPITQQNLNEPEGPVINGLEKSLRLCLAGLRVRRFDPIAEASELPDHSCSALLL